MAFPLWGTIKSYILGAWSWLDDPIEGLWDGFRNKILGAWSWLSDIWGTVRGIASAYWPWLNDPIGGLWGGFRAQILGTWTWLNTIDDRIRDIAWSHIAPKLGDWFWSFIVLNVTLVSKIGYRVLSTLWNMEWDDANKEAK